jgi:ABC-type antimicrobial peptide transport system permease subunit
MNKGWQILANVVLYGFLLWLLFDSTVVEWDPWFAFVVAFVVVVAVVVSLIPRIHATKVSPGYYPFDE